MSRRSWVWRTSPETARRMAEAVLLHQQVLSQEEILRGRFLAVRLGDGGTDGTVYETRDAAVTASRNSPSRHCYFQIPLEGITAEECDLALWYTRRVYDSGHREDPAHQLILPTRREALG
jgi:hypothetical protein